jgi:hypothetical protein
MTASGFVRALSAKMSFFEKFIFFKTGEGVPQARPKPDQNPKKARVKSFS